MKTMDVILLILGIFTVIFIVVNLQLFYTHYAIPDNLVISYFAAVFGECGAMAWIKNTKEKKQQREWDLEDYLRYKKEQEENKNAN